MPLEAYSPGTLTVTIGADPVTTLVLELGTPGPQGQTGAQGATGAGVPVGGTAGQVLAKIDGTNYNTEWVTKNGGVWGQITGTISNQTDLQNALNAKYDASNPSGYITTSALAPYLLSSTAASTYLTQANASSTYLTQSNASSTYLTISNADSTYFPKPTGTTSQYIRGDGSLNTFPPVGDRYLTSSTSTLTIDNGNGKTMTVGTGLSYSRQQDITVSYNNANHMHGTVLTYDPTTGVMTFDSNTHSGSGTYSNWEVNVGGVAGAILPVGGTSGQVLAKTNSTNFNTEWVSLGSMATETATDYLDKAGNLSGLANAGTARTNLGVAYATDAEVGSGLSTSTVISPNTLSRLLLQRKITALQGGLQTQTLGAGFGLTQLTTYNNLNVPNNTSGFVRGYINSPFSIPNFRGFLTPWQMGIGFGLNNATLPSYNGQILIVRYGEPFAPTAGVAWPENPTAKRIGFKFLLGGSNTVKLQVHNGTTYTEVDSGYVPAAISGNGNHYFVFGTDGAGNITLTIWKPDGTTVTCSTANGPTGTYDTGGGSSFGYQASIAGTTTTGYNTSPTHSIIQIGY